MHMAARKSFSKVENDFFKKTKVCVDSWEYDKIFCRRGSISNIYVRFWEK
jgi:hypothetical protein